MMKTRIKYRLSELGLFTKIDLIRHLSDIGCWIRNGCAGFAPAPVKRMIIASYLNRYRLCHFIETGTHVGDTLADIAHNRAVSCVSIELADSYYQVAKQRFETYTNVSLLQGDSGVVLPELVRSLDAPALFWLDGHYSGGDTGRGEVGTPVSAELKSILDSPIKTHVILIDDARLFDGTQTYPHLDSLLQTVRQVGSHDIEVSADIIRLTPKT